MGERERREWSGSLGSGKKGGKENGGINLPHGRLKTLAALRTSPEHKRGDHLLVTYKNTTMPSRPITGLLARVWQHSPWIGWVDNASRLMINEHDDFEANSSVILLTTFVFYIMVLCVLWTKSRAGDEVTPAIWSGDWVRVTPGVAGAVNSQTVGIRPLLNR